MDLRVLEQSHSDAEDHASNRLAAGGLRVDDATNVEDAQRTVYPHQTEVRVDPNLDELGTERIDAMLSGRALQVDVARTRYLTKSVSGEDSDIALASRRLVSDEEVA